MAFTPLSLFALGGSKSQGQTLWLYSTTDAMTTVDNTDYFAASLWRGMKVGDPVFVIKTDGPNFYATCVSAIDSDGHVTVAAASTLV